MIRENTNCWIKIEPACRQSAPSSLHIILNDEEHHFEVYDSDGTESNKIYFAGCKANPSFYLKSGDKCFRVDFKNNGVKILPIAKIHKMDTYIKDNCSCNSPGASCWGVAKYFTSRPEKPPFNEM